MDTLWPTPSAQRVSRSDLHMSIEELVPPQVWPVSTFHPVSRGMRDEYPPLDGLQIACVSEDTRLGEP